MTPPRLEVADIFRRHGEDYRTRHATTLSPEQLRAMRAIEQCRTSALGGHVDQCDTCGHQVISYNSCRNRHCPKCQSLAKAQWLQARRAELLPVPYYHVVFTVPDRWLAPLALQNKRVFYNILFGAVAQTLLTIAADPKHLGARIGFIAILHSWGQRLLHHPHIHCVVPGGGISPDGQRWIACRPDFFLPVGVLSRLFRRLLLEALQRAFNNGQLQFHGALGHLANPRAFAQVLQICRQTEWVAYVKPPFGGPRNVMDYLARYTHRVAIANHRLLGLDKGQVTFGLKNYRHGGKRETMRLDAREFIRRFLLHVLPDGFMRIRHFGLFANCHRTEKLKRCREFLGNLSPEASADDGDPLPLQAMDWPDLMVALTGEDPLACPKCRRGRLVRIQQLPPTPFVDPVTRAPPGVDSS